MGDSLRLDHVRLARPDGAVLIQDANAGCDPAIAWRWSARMGSASAPCCAPFAGIWRFGQGRRRGAGAHATVILVAAAVPADRTLREVVSIPSPAGAFPTTRSRGCCDWSTWARRESTSMSMSTGSSAFGRRATALALARAFLIEPTGSSSTRPPRSREESEARLLQAVPRAPSERAIVSIETGRAREVPQPSLVAHAGRWRSGAREAA